jgi:hypothetical protein
MDNFVNTFFDNLFGTISGHHGLYRNGGGMDFIPANGQGGTIQIKGDTASWLGLKNRLMQKYAYDYCFPVACVVDRLAEYDIAGTLQILRAKGKGKDNFATGEWATRMKNFLLQPNPLQSWEQFRGQQNIYKRVFGFCPVLPIVPVGFEALPEYAISMINLPPWLFDAQSTRKILYQSKLEEMVKEYRVTILGQMFTLQPHQVIILEDSFMQDESTDFLLPQSRLVGLDMAVSNLCASMEADNVLLKKKGPLGAWSHDAAASKDSVAGYVPMSHTEKKELQDALQQYGMSWNQYQYVISRQPIKWASMSFNVKELGTKETVEQSERAICHRYGYPYVLYEESGSTYANGINASKNVYQNNIIPNNIKDLAKYNKFFKAEENNAKIVCDYSELPALQEDKLLQAQAANELNSALEKEYLNNVITLNEWRTARGYDTRPDGDVFYKDTKQAQVKPPVDKEDEIEVDIAA